jgi:3' terminal RNA ribose 2'-O-methyltransferase Hen1
VLDNTKHYAVGDAEVEKLLHRGEGWLSQHPERNLIASRYLKHRKHLTQIVMARLIEEDPEAVDEVEEVHAIEEEKLEERISLNEQRINSVISVLRSVGAGSVIDLGCGQGKLLSSMLPEKQFTRLVGMDVSFHALEVAKRRLRFDDMPERQKARIQLMHGSLTYRDTRLSGFDAATCIEVIEHLDLYRLNAFERVLFEFARPKTVVLTTPNVEYNAKFETLPAGKMRHKDHRFEWTREEFRLWAEAVAARHGYDVRFLPIGNEDSQLGAPTQMGVFSR